MTHRHQDIPIRPRYGYVDEDSGQENRQRSGGAGTAAGQTTPASSYTEIPFLAQYPGAVPDSVLQDLTPTAGPGNPLPGTSGESYVNLDSGAEDGDEEELDPEEEEDNSNTNSNSKDSSAGDMQRHRLKAESSSMPP